MSQFRLRHWAKIAAKIRPRCVRELENAMVRVLALALSDRIDVDDLPPEIGAAPSTIQTADEIRTLAEVKRDYIAAALRALGG
jgi:DNA-binding NtrC family response regulator